MTEKKLNYKKLVLETGTARKDAVYKIKGNSLLILKSPLNIDLRLHSLNNDTVELKQYDSVVEEFEEFYITHDAQAGGKIEIIVYNDQKFKIFLSGRQSKSGGATLVNNKALSLTNADTEYAATLSSTKKLIFINNSVDAVYKISFVSGDSANGLSIKPQTHKEIEALDFSSASIYAQSDVAAKTLYFWEFL